MIDRRGQQWGNEWISPQHIDPAAKVEDVSRLTLGVKRGLASLVLGHLVDSVLLAVLGGAVSLLHLRNGHLKKESRVSTHSRGRRVFWPGRRRRIG